MIWSISVKGKCETRVSVEAAVVVLGLDLGRKEGADGMQSNSG